MKCDKCQNKAYCDEHVGIRRICKRNGYNGFVMYTNADRIRSMTDDELMRLLLGVRIGNRPWCDDEPCNERYCSGCITEWLKEEVQI